MIGIQEALRRIELQQQAIARSYLAVPLDMHRECKTLTEVSADFARRASEPRKVKPLLDPAAVWRQWAASQFDPDALDARQIRTLCVSPETTTRPELVKGLQKNSSALARTSCLMGLVFSYFAKWGEIRQQNEIEALITGSLRVYSRRNPLILQYRENADLLFNSNAANRLGSRAVEKREQVKIHLAGFRIGLAANLAVSALSAAARSFRSLLSPVSENEGAARLKYAIQDVLVPELPISDFQAVVSALIVSDWVEKHPASETGNASHAFPASAFERRAGRLRNFQFNFNKLKHQANEDRILHLGAWEMYARNKLASWGVRR
jgi:hypothetical protein